MGTKGNNTTTSTTGPAPEAQSAYDALLNRASGVASTPYQAYGGQLTAGINGQQQAGINNINQNAGFAQPYFQQAGGLLQGAAQPLTQSQISNYYNPYQQQVIDSTQGQFNQMNKTALNNIQGNAAAQGALGGDRAGIAKDAYYQSALPGQEQAIAGLESQGYNQALSTASQQYQQNPTSIAYGLGNIGGSGQAAALSGANAQFGVGTAQQQTEQANLNALYGQYQQAQAFPYQQTQWLAGIDTGVGSQLGGTSTTTPPAPNPLNQVLGLAATAAGAYMGAKRGGRIAGFDSGGSVMPWGGAQGWIPGVGIVRGQGAPHPPSVPNQGQGASPQASKAAAGVGAGLANWNQGISTDPAGSGFPMEGSADANSLSAMVPMGGGGFGIGGVKTGGRIQGFADGGPTDIRSRQQKTTRLGRGQFGPVESWSNEPGETTYPWSSSASRVGDDRPPWLGSSAPAPSPTGQIYARGGSIAGFADGGSPSFDDQWSSLSGLGSIAPIQPDVVPMPAQRPMSAPRPNVDYSGTDMAPVDATDINLNAGSGGLGLGSPYEGTNPAIMADSGVNPGVPRGPIAGVGAGAGAPMAYGPGYGRQAGFASPAPPQASPQGGFFDNLPGRGILSHAAGQGLMAAGLGMMASKSPFLGQAIGEGGLRGLGEYTGEQQREANLAHQQAQESLEGRKVQIESDKLAAEADRWQKQIGIETSKPQVVATDMFGKPIHGVLDPKSGTWVDPLTRQPIDAAKIQSGREGAMGATAKMMANYALPPISPMRMATPEGQMLNAAILKENPDYNATYYNEANKARTAFGSGTLGNSVRSYGTAISHLDVLNDAVDALGNGNIKLINAAKQRMQTELGLSTAPTSFDAIKPIVSAEITKAIVGSNMTQGDREEMQAGLRRDLSSMAIKDVIAKYKSLMGGQLVGLERQYRTSTHGAKDFEEKLSPAAVDMLHQAQGVEAGKTAPAGTAPTSAPPVQPPNVPAGSLYSQSRKQWKTPSGQIFNADGSLAVAGGPAS